MTKRKHPDLTDRDRKLLAHLALGKKDTQIAAEMTLTPGTVRVYLHRLYQKIKVANRTEAAVWWTKEK